MEGGNVGEKKEVRRPMNAFLIFCKRHRSVVREKNPELDNRSVTRLLGDLWANLGEEKATYTSLAKQNKDAFMKAHPNYKWHSTDRSHTMGRAAGRPVNPKMSKSLVETPSNDDDEEKMEDASQIGGLNLLLMAGKEMSRDKESHFPTSPSLSVSMSSPLTSSTPATSNSEAVVAVSTSNSALLQLAEMCTSELCSPVAATSSGLPHDRKDHRSTTATPAGFGSPTPTITTSLVSPPSSTATSTAARSFPLSKSYPMAPPKKRARHWSLSESDASDVPSAPDFSEDLSRRTSLSSALRPNTLSPLNLSMLKPRCVSTGSVSTLDTFSSVEKFKMTNFRDPSSSGTESLPSPSPPYHDGCDSPVFEPDVSRNTNRHEMSQLKDLFPGRAVKPGESQQSSFNSGFSQTPPHCGVSPQPAQPPFCHQSQPLSLPRPLDEVKKESSSCEHTGVGSLLRLSFPRHPQSQTQQQSFPTSSASAGSKPEGERPEFLRWRDQNIDKVCYADENPPQNFQADPWSPRKNKVEKPWQEKSKTADNGYGSSKFPQLGIKQDVKALLNDGKIKSLLNCPSTIPPIHSGFGMRPKFPEIKVGSAIVNERKFGSCENSQGKEPSPMCASSFSEGKMKKKWAERVLVEAQLEEDILKQSQDSKRKESSDSELLVSLLNHPPLHAKKDFPVWSSIEERFGSNTIAGVKPGQENCVTANARSWALKGLCRNEDWYGSAKSPKLAHPGGSVTSPYLSSGRGKIFTHSVNTVCKSEDISDPPASDRDFVKQEPSVMAQHQQPPREFLKGSSNSPGIEEKVKTENIMSINSGRSSDERLKSLKSCLEDSTDMSRTGSIIVQNIMNIGGSINSRTSDSEMKADTSNTIAPCGMRMANNIVGRLFKSDFSGEKLSQAPPSGPLQGVKENFGKITPEFNLKEGGWLKGEGMTDFRQLSASSLVEKVVREVCGSPVTKEDGFSCCRLDQKSNVSSNSLFRQPSIDTGQSEARHTTAECHIHGSSSFTTIAESPLSTNAGPQSSLSTLVSSHSCPLVSSVSLPLSSSTCLPVTSANPLLASKEEKSPMIPSVPEEASSDGGQNQVVNFNPGDRDAHENAADDVSMQQPVRKSSRANRGQKYQALINEGIIQPSRERLAARIAEKNGQCVRSREVGEKAEAKRGLKRWASDKAVPSAGLPGSEGHGDGGATVGEEQVPSSSSFDLEKEIKSLPVCSLDPLEKKRASRRRCDSDAAPATSAPRSRSNSQASAAGPTRTMDDRDSKADTTIGSKSGHSVPSQRDSSSSESSDPTEWKGHAPHIPVPKTDQSAEPVTGSRKRKIRKHCITRISVVEEGKAKDNNVDPKRSKSHGGAAPHKQARVDPTPSDRDSGRNLPLAAASSSTKNLDAVTLGIFNQWATCAKPDGVSHGDGHERERTLPVRGTGLLEAALNGRSPISPASTSSSSKIAEKRSSDRESEKSGTAVQASAADEPIPVSSWPFSAEATSSLETLATASMAARASASQSRELLPYLHRATTPPPCSGTPTDRVSTSPSAGRVNNPLVGDTLAAAAVPSQPSISGFSVLPSVTSARSLPSSGLPSQAVTTTLSEQTPCGARITGRSLPISASHASKDMDIRADNQSDSVDLHTIEGGAGFLSPRVRAENCLADTEVSKNCNTHEKTLEISGGECSEEKVQQEVFVMVQKGERSGNVDSCSCKDGDIFQEASRVSGSFVNTVQESSSLSTYSPLITALSTEVNRTPSARHLDTRDTEFWTEESKPPNWPRANRGSTHSGLAQSEHGMTSSPSSKKELPLSHRPSEILRECEQKSLVAFLLSSNSAKMEQAERGSVVACATPQHNSTAIFTPAAAAAAAGMVTNTDTPHTVSEISAYANRSSLPSRTPLSENCEVPFRISLSSCTIPLSSLSTSISSSSPSTSSPSSLFTRLRTTSAGSRSPSPPSHVIPLSSPCTSPTTANEVVSYSVMGATGSLVDAGSPSVIGSPRLPESPSLAFVQS